MDPNNPIVKLCSEGMQAEFEGRYDDARALFTQAWESSTDDYEACVAAHFLARQQESPGDALKWNQEALNRANAVGDESVLAFYPSLYLNIGYSHEILGNQAEAIRYYDLAADRLDDLPAGSYGDTVRNGINQARKRTGAMEE